MHDCNYVRIFLMTSKKRRYLWCFKIKSSVRKCLFSNDSVDDLAILTCQWISSIYLGTKLEIFRQNAILFHLGENNSSQCIHSFRVTDFNQNDKDDPIFINPEVKSVRLSITNIVKFCCWLWWYVLWLWINILKPGNEPLLWELWTDCHMICLNM